MRIVPDEMDVKLPRALFGGLKQGPTEELLRRVAQDYALLCDENRKLKAAIGRFEPRAIEPAVSPQPEPAPAENVKSQQAPREANELTRLVLAAARAAREMRESARRDCESMLKKASSRARDLERDAERAKAAREAELEELEALKRETCERMRASLQTILRTP